MARFSISGSGDGEESSHLRSRKKPRLRPIAEDEALTGNSNAGSSREDEETPNPRRGDANGGIRSTTCSDHRGEVENHDDGCREKAEPESCSVNGGNSSISVTLTDPDLLDCAVCCEPLKIPIFQCDNGHIACAPCCDKLRHKCPSCSMPIGYYRCRAMERILEAIKVPCPNAEYGCTENIPYGERSAHENECKFMLCSCPLRDCNFASSYKHLTNHFRGKHGYLNSIACDKPVYFTMNIDNEMAVLSEEKEGELIVVQTFKVSHGMCVGVSCISPLARGVGEFSYSLQSFSNGDSLTLQSRTQMKRVQKVSLDPPVESFMLIPSYLFIGGADVKLNLCITRNKY